MPIHSTFVLPLCQRSRQASWLLGTYPKSGGSCQQSPFRLHGHERLRQEHSLMLHSCKEGAITACLGLCLWQENKNTTHHPFFIRSFYDYRKFRLPSNHLLTSYRSSPTSKNYPATATGSEETMVHPPVEEKQAGKVNDLSRQPPSPPHVLHP